MEPTDRDPIVRRLHSLGSQPVDPEVVASHRNLMASVPVTSSRSRLRPLMVGSLLAGSLLGGMGLAAAAPGVPDSASDVAKTVLATVTLGAVEDPEEEKADKAAKADDANDTPEAKAAAQRAKAERKAAKAANHPAGGHGVTRSTVGCPTGFTGNHGQYVSSVTDDPSTDINEREVAATSECGKPVHAPKAPKPAHQDNANKPATPGQSGERGRSSTAGENSQSGTAPGNRPNERAVANVREHRKADAGRSAGHGPVTTTTVAVPAS